MKTVFEIPQMSNNDIAHYYASIRPIVNHDRYLRALTQIPPIHQQTMQKG